MCRGAQIFFGSLLGCPKKGFQKKKGALFVFVFFMLEKVKRKIWKKKGKSKISKNAGKNSVFGWLWRKMVFFFVKLSFFRKIGKHYLCSEGKKRTRIFVATICFWKMVLFLWPFQVMKHYKKGVSASTGAKPKMALLVAKVPFWEGGLERGFTICDTYKLCSAENTIFIVFSAQHSSADMRECNLIKKTKI